MPKKVDVEQRRQLIAAALQRVVGTSGLAGVSLRSVAAEAGISMGLVQHYFASKDEMLLFAMQGIEARIGERHAAEVARTSEVGPSTTLRALLRQTLPIDEERRQEAMAYLMAGLAHPAIGERIRIGLDTMTEFVVTCLRAEGVTTDVERQARGLIALSEGLTVHVLGGFMESDAALEVLDGHLDDLLGPAVTG